MPEINVRKSNVRVGIHRKNILLLYAHIHIGKLFYFDSFSIHNKTIRRARVGRVFYENRNEPKWFFPLVGITNALYRNQQLTNAKDSSFSILITKIGRNIHH